MNLPDTLSSIQWKIQQAADGMRELSQKELDEISEKLKDCIEVADHGDWEVDEV